MFIAMVLTKQPFRLKIACLLDTLYTNEPTLEESVSEESNYVVPLESTYPTLVTLPDPYSHTTILATDQVPWKTYYRRNPRKEVGSLIVQPAPVQDSKPLRGQDREDRVDENEVVAESIENETKQDHQGNISKHDPSLDLPIALRNGTKSCTKHSISNYVSYKNLSPPFRTFTAKLDSNTISKNIHLALECLEWKTAVMEEMRALKKNNTWDLCTLPKRHNTVGCKWIFALKYKADCILDRSKVRLVAKGFTQTYGIDYSETFSPIAKLNTVRVLLQVVVNKDWPLYQLDVKNVFLKGDLEEEVYMSPPPGFDAQFDILGYNQGHSDHTLFTKVSKIGKIAILIVYVDDIVLSEDDTVEIIQLKKKMEDEFEIKDLGNLKYFLEMEVARSRECISVS
ncbi:Cysteine-rich RLK (receptor-like protein kinase) 8 [Cucumis melo var. makuwa]|uniref:Cysteine-rich RLK (Receptor-like protein kinase) 8 n=1 Tax=Cucumis melo var. makuwa TaxID=1194695 RepID=A0A5D3DSE6_CUCMM|nr:Cysteine-rich RLK (receptor-like protein kinase) 8 [Cucumis melo var. makuwa]